MGICRCQRLNTTNHFCYEHHMNVCQYCVLESHQSCIVKSYNSWLNSSEFNPICLFCNHHLNSSPCVRLHCWDVVHINCLMRAFSDETDPSKINCPECHASIIPPGNMVSPIVDELLIQLRKMEWYNRLIESGYLSSDYTSPPNQRIVSSFGIENKSSIELAKRTSEYEHSTSITIGTGSSRRPQSNSPNLNNIFRILQTLRLSSGPRQIFLIIVLFFILLILCRFIY